MDVPNSQPITSQKTLNIKLPNDMKSRSKRDLTKTNTDPPLYYEAQQLNEEEYNKKHGKFLRKTEPLLSKALDNLTQALQMFKSGKITRHQC